MRAGLLRAGSVCAFLLALFAVAAASTASAATGSQAFTSAGEHTFVVPAGVTSLRVMLVGGNGGAGVGGALGGAPSTVQAMLAVSPGETLYVEVGGDGQPAQSGGDAALGGYNGGGIGGEAEVLVGAASGGGGGGASDIRVCGVSEAGCQSLAARLVVAAGGGAGGGTGISSGAPSGAGGAGGAGDTLPGGAPGQQDPQRDAAGTGGGRATASGPGAAGTSAGLSGAASAGTVGSAGAGALGAPGGGGGGGGGGLYGGGGGGGGAGIVNFQADTVAGSGGGGGGGGSSGVPAGATGVSDYQFLPTATGAEPEVGITWTLPPPAVVTTAATAVTSTSATINGTVNPDNSPLTDCHFTVSPTPPAGASVPCSQQVPSGGTPVAVSANLLGLSPSRAYTFTLSAASAIGGASGSALTFTTLGVAARPVLSALRVSSLTFALAGELVNGRCVKPTRKTRQLRHCTRPIKLNISYRLSIAARATITIASQLPGRLIKGRCVKATDNKRKQRSCTRLVAVPGTLTLDGHSGANSFTFNGRIAGHKLGRGRYALTATPTIAGLPGEPQTVTFIITS